MQSDACETDFRRKILFMFSAAAPGCLCKTSVNQEGNESNTVMALFSSHLERPGGLCWKLSLSTL